MFTYSHYQICLTTFWSNFFHSSSDIFFGLVSLTLVYAYRSLQYIRSFILAFQINQLLRLRLTIMQEYSSMIHTKIRSSTCALLLLCWNQCHYFNVCHENREEQDFTWKTLLLREKQKARDNPPSKTNNNRVCSTSTSVSNRSHRSLRIIVT